MVPEKVRPITIIPADTNSPRYRLFTKALRISSSFFWPKYRLMMIPTPTLMPIIRAASSRITGMVLPTAARAVCPRYRPTTMLSVME